MAVELIMLEYLSTFDHLESCTFTTTLPLLISNANSPIEKSVGLFGWESIIWSAVQYWGHTPECLPSPQNGSSFPDFSTLGLKKTWTSLLLITQYGLNTDTLLFPCSSILINWWMHIPLTNIPRVDFEIEVSAFFVLKSDRFSYFLQRKHFLSLLGSMDQFFGAVTPSFNTVKSAKVIIYLVGKLPCAFPVLDRGHKHRQSHHWASTPWNELWYCPRRVGNECRMAKYCQ